MPWITKQKEFTKLYEAYGKSANLAVAALQKATGADIEDAVSDLLADLMHWCDWHEQDFEKELKRARGHYETEMTEYL